MRRIDRDSIPHLVHCLIRNAVQKQQTLCGRLGARWWGLRLGDHCRFQGRIRYWRHPGSQITIGDNCSFRASTNRPCFLQTLSERAILKIGSGSGLNGAYVGCRQYVEIGRNVKCGADATIWDTDFHPEDPRSGPDEPVIIGDNVWLGVNVTVMKGVSIGEHTLVGPGSLVMRSLPAGIIAMGVPARPVKKLDVGRMQELENLLLEHAARTESHEIPEEIQV